jgi:hypothetical protein
LALRARQRRIEQFGATQSYVIVLAAIGQRRRDGAEASRLQLSGARFGQPVKYGEYVAAEAGLDPPSATASIAAPSEFEKRAQTPRGSRFAVQFHLEQLQVAPGE